jgi:hypothetical protein
MDNLDLDRVWACLFDREADLARGDGVPLSGLIAVHEAPTLEAGAIGVPEGAGAYARARQLCKQLDHPVRI